MTKEDTVIATYATHEQAEETIRDLQKSGFDMKKLSIIGRGYRLEEHPVGFYTTGDRMKTWGGVGALWGGFWGLLVGAGFFWLPGVGPLLVAGPVVHMLVAAAEGAALVGGASALGGALASIGVPKASIVKYEADIKADRYLVIAHGNAATVGKARKIMQDHAAMKTEPYAA